MLIGFSVQNYMSFQSTQSLSMTAAKHTRHKHHLKSVNNRNVLTAAAIYGANASGKSNLCSAMSYSKAVIEDGIPAVNPGKKYFRLDPACQNQPGVFEYRIEVDNHEYEYGIASGYRSRRIESEWLYRKNGRNNETCLFERTYEDGVYTVRTDLRKVDISFLTNFEGEVSSSLQGKSILSEAAEYAKKDSPLMMEIRSVRSWFDRFYVITPDSHYVFTNEITSDGKIREEFEKQLVSFDTGIEKLVSATKTIDFDALGFPDKLKQELLEKTAETSDGPVMLTNEKESILLNKNADGDLIYKKLLMNHGNDDELFEMDDESDGTRRLFDLIPMLTAKQNSSVFVIDEIDRCMHSLLVKEFLTRFFDRHKFDKTQIIFTTHDTNLMDLDLFRQDEIWFVDRNRNKASELFSLNKFKVRFDKIPKNDYLLGRYGAVPFFTDICEYTEDELPDESSNEESVNESLSAS